MPRKSRELSAVQVRRLDRPGFHAVGGVAGLHLQVTSRGARTWILRATMGGRRRDMGLGGFPDVPLALAREKAARARDQIDQGCDPIAARKAARAALVAENAAALTFSQAAERFLTGKLHEFRSIAHGKQWRATLDAYAGPVIGALPVADVTLPHIVSVLQPLWLDKTETATRLRGRIEAVLAWATVSGYRTGDNPARWRGNLDAVLPAPRKIAKVQHHRAVPWRDVPHVVRALRERDGVAARALEFLALTAARSGEVRGATWSEIDLKARTWTVPAARMKSGRVHRVPLAPAAVQLLKAMPHFQDVESVFPAPRGGRLSDMAMLAVLRRMKVDAVPHGFRSTFRDWCAERTAYPRELAEAALAHVNSDRTEAAYLRTDLFDARRRLMAEWAKYCNSAARAAVRGARA
jgi:integrase